MSFAAPRRRFLISVICAALSWWVGCTDPGGGASADLGTDAGQPEEDARGSSGLVALWQPPDGPLPAPTDYWRTDDDKLRPPTDESLGDARVAYNRYLASLGGYPVTTRVRFPIDSRVKTSSLAGNVHAFDATTAEEIEFEAAWYSKGGYVGVDFDGQVLEPGHDYSVVLRGGDEGIVGVDGRPLEPDEAFRLLRGTSEITTSRFNFDTGSADAQMIARRLGEIRSDYRSSFQYVSEKFDLSRSDVSVLTEFRTSLRTTLWFEPDTGRMPVPNDYRWQPGSGTVRVPVNSEDSREIKEVKRAVARYDGFSTSGALFARTTGPIDPDSVDDQSVQLYRNKGGEWTKVDAYEVGLFQDEQTIWAEPRPAIEPKARYAVVITDSVETVGGRGIAAQPAGAMIRSEAPLVDANGESRLPIFESTQAQRLERLRKRNVSLTKELAKAGTPRSSLAAAVPFRTMNVLDEHLARRKRLFEEGISTKVEQTEAKSPLRRGLLVAMPDVETIVTGKMTTLDFLDPKTRRFRKRDVAKPRRIDFVLTVPEGYGKGEKIPVVLFGHGLMTSRELVYLIANRLAEAGFAAFSIDLPYHGNRSICLSDSSCRGNVTCTPEGRCVEPDGSEGELRRAKAPEWLWQDSPDYPVTTGMPFIEMDDLIGARDHFAQAMVDLMQGLRVIRGADWRKATGGFAIDGDDVVYFGMSLGGILGGSLSGVEPNIDDFALNVPGGDFVELISNSEIFKGIFRAGLQDRGIERGSDAYVEFMQRVHWLMDPVDPMNLGRYARERSMTYRHPETGEMKRAPKARVLIQMADGDSIMPNQSTRILADRVGASISTYEPAVSDHGFVFDPTSIEGSEARDEIAEFFKGR